MTKQTRNLLILFLTIFIVKASISFFMSGTYFYSDEACVVIKAKHFADTLQMLPCKEIAHAPGGDPHPLYSIIIAPFFFFFKGFSAYQAVLVFNSLAIASLVFPLYWITKNFIKKEWTALLIITVTLFLPQITVYEKMLLTESFFVFLNIWLLYFYGKYKTEKKDTRKYLLLTILFTIMAGLERPFGFITTLALISNEIITSKNRKKVLFYLIPIFLIIGLFTFLILGNLWTKVLDLMKIFQDLKHLKFFIFALKNQLNSLSIATLFVPLLSFIALFLQKSSTDFFKKTKWYLFTLFLTNFLISANHLYGYLIKNQISDLITRYVNITIILLIFFFLIFIFKNKKNEIKTSGIVAAIIAMFSLAFLNSLTVKHSLNLDLSMFYNTKDPGAENLISQNKLLEYFFFPLIILFFAFFVFNKKKELKILYITIILIFGISLYPWNINYSKTQNANNIYTDNKENILLLQPEGTRIANFFVWKTKTLTDNTIDLKYLELFRAQYSKINFYNESIKQNLKEYSLIISQAKLHLPVKEKQENSMILYYPPQGQNYEEHIEILKAENKPFIEPSEPSKENNPQNTPSLTPQENDKEQS